MAREKGAGLGMGVQHGAGPTVPHDGLVQLGFGAGPSLALNHQSAIVHNDQIPWANRPFVMAARGHQQQQGGVAEGAAEVPARAITPATLVNLRHCCAEVYGKLFHAVGHTEEAGGIR